MAANMSLNAGHIITITTVPDEEVKVGHSMKHAFEGLSDAETQVHSPALTRDSSLESLRSTGEMQGQVKQEEQHKIVVKATFIELDEGPGLRAKFMSSRSKTDSFLALREDVDEMDETSEDKDCREGFAPSSSSSSSQAETAEDAAAAFSRCVVAPPEPAFAESSKAKRQQVQKKGRAQKKAAYPSQPAERTTVMLRNIPNNYTRDMLLSMLDDEGFAGRYDFLYLPMDFGRFANLGYAFVNLVDSRATDAFWTVFDGFSRWSIPTAKVCEVSWSGPYQGLAAHIERYKNSPVMHKSVPDEYKPMIFSNGVRQTFPPASKKVKAPHPAVRR